MSTQDTEPGSPQRSAWPLIVVLALVVAGVIVAGLVVLMRDDSDPGAETTASPEPTPTAPVRDGADPSAEGFATPRSDALGRKIDVPRNGLGVILPQATDQQKSFGDPGAMTTPAQGIRWQQSSSVVIPFSTSDGPDRMDGQIPAGFAQTPAGAALAAASITMRMMDGRLAVETVEKQVDRSAANYAEGLAAVGKIPADTSIGDRLPRPSGYEIEECDPTYCLVWLHTRLPDGRAMAAASTLVWVDGDWKKTTNTLPAREGTDDGLVQW